MSFNQGGNLWGNGVSSIQFASQTSGSSNRFLQSDDSSSVPGYQDSNSGFTATKNSSSFGISEVRKFNYTGPQGDFNKFSKQFGGSSYHSEDSSSCSSSSNSTDSSSSSSNSTDSSSSRRQLDWSGLVDNVFQEEIEKLSAGYKNGKFL